MKKLLIISTIIVGTIASAGVASALDYSAGYPDWANTALDSSEDNR